MKPMTASNFDPNVEKDWLDEELFDAARSSLSGGEATWLASTLMLAMTLTLASLTSGYTAWSSLSGDVG